MEDSSAVNFTAKNTVQPVQNSALYEGTVQAEGTSYRRKATNSTEKENLLENTVHLSITHLKNGTNPDSSTQALQSKDDGCYLSRVHN